jgi:signal transduction histidine kinase
MSGNRWWHVTVGGAIVVVAVLVVSQPVGAAWRSGAALGVLAAFGAYYFAGGWRGLQDGRWAVPLQIAVMIATALGTAFSPNMAALQSVAFPLIWSLCPGPSMRRPILLCVALAALTAVGFSFSLGGGLDAVAEGVGIETVSLALGIGIGVWFTSEMRKGDENTRLLAELTAAQDQLAAMHRESGAAAERERFARELHDTIAQSLTSVVMVAQRGSRLLADDAGHADRNDPHRVPAERRADARAEFELVEEVAREALTEARALVAATAPVAVEGGLSAALSRVAASFQRETGVTVSTALATVADLPRELEVVLLRCAQEALANVRKHSRARSAALTLAQAPIRDADGHMVHLTVADDGVGLPDAPRTPPRADHGSAGDGESRAVPESWVDRGFGLEGMRQRLALVGGALEVTTNPTGGTTLLVTVPHTYHPDTAADGTPASAHMTGLPR